LKRFLERTTFEISCPVLRDDRLAPVGKTGLIVSMLFDFLAKHIGKWDGMSSGNGDDTIDILVLPWFKQPSWFT
jgi:hypothetical protein